MVVEVATEADPSTIYGMGKGGPDGMGPVAHAAETDTTALNYLHARRKDDRHETSHVTVHEGHPAWSETRGERAGKTTKSEREEGIVIEGEQKTGTSTGEAQQRGTKGTGEMAEAGEREDTWKKERAIEGMRGRGRDGTSERRRDAFLDGHQRAFKGVWVAYGEGAEMISRSYLQRRACMILL